MRTINVTGGYTDYAVADITEATGKNLSGSTIKACLLPKGAVVPASGAGVWRTPLVTYPATGTAHVSLLIGSDTTPGDYYLWVDIEDSPTVVPVRASNDVVRVI